MEREQLVRLREMLVTKFDEGELQTLCFDLGVDYASLPGKRKADKARELVAYFERRSQIPELLETGRAQRPDIPWSDTSAVTPEETSPPQNAAPGASQKESAGSMKGLTRGQVFALVGLLIGAVACIAAVARCQRFDGYLAQSLQR